MGKKALKESRGEFKTRIEAAGKWGDFVRRRETLKGELRIQLGGDVKAAASQAWELAMAEFPPATVSAATGDDAAFRTSGAFYQSPPGARVQPAPAHPKALTPPPETWAGKQKSSARADWDWVYHHIIIPEPDPATCPSAGAWGLWEWGRSNRVEFYRCWSQTTAKTQSKLEELLEKFSDDGGQLAFIDKLLGSLGPPANVGFDSSGDRVSGVDSPVLQRAGLDVA